MTDTGYSYFTIEVAFLMLDVLTKQQRELTFNEWIRELPRSVLTELSFSTISNAIKHLESLNLIVTNRYYSSTTYHVPRRSNEVVFIEEES